MRANIITSSFKAFPGFAILIAAVFLTEAYVYANRPNLVNDYWNKFLINENAVVELSGNYDALILGNSIQKTGIRTDLLGDAKVLSLGVAGAKPMAHYLLFKRYLRHHAPPKIVFLYVDFEDQRDSFFVALRYFVGFREFLEVFGDLSWEERRVFLGRYFATLDLRKVGLRGKRDVYPGPNGLFVRRMAENRGFMPAPRAGGSLAADYFSTNKERLLQKASFSARDRRYLDKLAALAEFHGVKIVLIGIPVPAAVKEALDTSGFWEDYRTAMERFRASRPSVESALEITAFDNSYFGDMSHLNDKGSAAYTETFRKNVYNRHMQSHV